VLGLRGDTLQQFAIEEALATTCGWVWWHENVCAISDRPESITRNANGRLHNEAGPSMRYRDGWSLWTIDGIAVDEQIVMMPDTQTIKQINSENNADVKSIRITRFGWPRYLKETKSKVIHERHNDVEGTYEALFSSPDGSRRLVATCPTGRVFAMGVPNEIETCEQAQNWLGGEPLNAPSRCLGRT
jgi:hypothetical protein